MEHALDSRGILVHHYDAIKSESYICPDCGDYVRPRSGNGPCFFHKNIKNRTPLQKTCPEYHEGMSKYSWIIDRLDEVYIKNGGIPLYLCGEKEKFELRAYFPAVSEAAMKRMCDVGVKVHVNINGGHYGGERVFSVQNLSFYGVETLQSWIHVECKPVCKEPEIMRKWIWGIKGVDIKKDIYHDFREGGYRVAFKSALHLGKSYRIISKGPMPCISGIKFTMLGYIHFKAALKTVEYCVYRMELNSYTEDTRCFIESKGYRLLKQADELLPLWPPSVFAGNQIISDKYHLLFLHINRSGSQSVHPVEERDLPQATSGKTMRIIPITLVEDKTIAVSIEEKGITPQIRYNLIHSDKLTKKPLMNQEILIKDSNNNEANFSSDTLKPPEDGTLIICSNIPLTATVSRGSYVMYSGSTYIERVDYLRQLTIYNGAFGIMRYFYSQNVQKTAKHDTIDWDFEYSRLYRCVSPVVRVSSKNLMLFYILSRNINAQNIELYRLLEKWIKTNAVPACAQAYLNDIFRRIA